MDEEDKYILNSYQSEIINDLKFIGSVPQKCKINTLDKTISSESSLYYNIKRYFNNESRNLTLKFISKRINDGLTALIKLDEFWKKKILIEALLFCIKGLNNLKSTYFNDNYIVAEIDTLIKQINNAIQEECKENENLSIFIKSIS